MRTCVILLTILCVIATAAPAAGVIFVSTDPNYQVCEVSPTGLVTLYILHQSSVEVTGSRFSVPIPECLNPTVVSETVNHADYLGSFQTGITVTYDGGCQSGLILIGTLTLLFGDEPACCPFTVLSATGDRWGEAFDCAEVAMYTGTAGVLFKSPGDTSCPIVGYGPSHTPSPPDEATDVPLDVQLSWVENSWNPCLLLWSGGTLVVGFGTTDPPPSWFDVSGPPYDPGPLAPATTYFWRADYIFEGKVTSSPIWSFTTATGPTPIRETTWGKVKALYR